MPAPVDLTHRLLPMRGRDQHEPHRVATPLELLFDLTFVIAFAVAGVQFASLLALGHVTAGLGAFGFAMFAIVWAWINFTWFASAFDTDDWAYRLTTMVQMVGVMILALGLPPMFASIDQQQHLANEVMVLGYVVMRIAMLTQWLRVAAQSPRYRQAAITYAAALALAQVGWVAMIFLPLGLVGALVLAAVLIGVEMAGPALAEHKLETPWHPHHIAERYGALVIVALGETVVGTVASLGAVIQRMGWTLDVGLVAIAGMLMTFGMWWIYFSMPFGTVLHARRRSSFVWGYTHFVAFAAIAASGAGLNVAAAYIEGHSALTALATLLTVAIPELVFVAWIFTIYMLMIGRHQALHTWLVIITLAVFAGGVVMAVAGLSMVWCLLVVSLAPAVTVVGFELIGHRHLADSLAELDPDVPDRSA